MTAPLARLLAASALLVAAGASPGVARAGDPGDEPWDEEHSVALGDCNQGMTTVVTVVDPSALRCTLDDLPELVDFVCATSPEVCAFLHEVVQEHATVQCTPGPVVDGHATYCADVVDRAFDGTSLEGAPDSYLRNFFVAYADDQLFPESSEVAYWDEMLDHPSWLAPPVELSVAGWFTKESVLQAAWEQPMDLLRHERLLKFDPRGCAGCVPIYDGPNLVRIENPDELTKYYPSFDAASCAFQINGAGATTFLSQNACADEMAYRSIGR
jgi:hypothetical protein